MSHAARTMQTLISQIYFTISWELPMRFKHVGNNIVKFVVCKLHQRVMRCNQGSTILVGMICHVLTVLEAHTKEFNLISVLKFDIV